MDNLKNKCYVSSGAEDDDFVGFDYDKNDIKIYFPLGYRIPSDENELKRAIIKLIKTLNISTTSIYYDSEIYKEFNKEMELNNKLPILSCINLITDYLKYGLYKVVDKNFGSTGSKINWKKTIQNKDAVYGSGGFVYLDPIYERKDFKNNIITEIEKYCLKKSAKYIGWLYNNFTYDVPTILEDKDSDLMLVSLKKELSSSFQDRKKKLIISMIEIISGFDDDSIASEKFSYGTRYYRCIWELMLKDLYCNVNLKDYYPKGSYSLIGGNNFDASNLRPDTIYHDLEEDKYYILDAKYYRYCNTLKKTGLPSTSDIQKQITYASFINEQKNIDGNSIFNAFILPFDKNDNQLGISDAINYYGFATVDWVNIKNRYNYHKVEVLFMDTSSLIEWWSSRKTSENSLDVLKKIIEVNI